MAKIVLILFLVAILFIVIRAFVRANMSMRRSQSSRGGRTSIGRTNVFVPWPSAEVPLALGVPYGHPARGAAERLEASLSLFFESRVKDRVLKEFPRMSDKEWAWTWFEMKRYFFMCGIMRSIPMYSKQVDTVWHEMLMFTREYEEFCISFCGEMIHHAPHAPGAAPQPGERALFDWLYGELFAQAPASGRLWGAFYRTSMSVHKLDEIKEFSKETLRSQWFNTKASSRFADLSETIDYLIDRAKSQLVEAGSGRNEIGNNGRSYGYDPVLGATGLLSGMLIYHSITNPNDFTRQMDQAQSEEQRKANGSGDSTYGCSGSSDNGRDHSDGGDSGGSGGDSGGDSGGGSCGSSCGGGCSSS
ncbi:hypothetical protein [Paenibacillus sinopodophylli]|uniref:hypothetical protein n=1 Tax=Paenibacillus sinopodophylli TaxID=1837342 RepID=UPI00110CECDB|nr:hypothetical protein [Paenibacillus sinopodophylli]